MTLEYKQKQLQKEYEESVRKRIAAFKAWQKEKKGGK